jgi:hypothetical protein
MITIYLRAPLLTDYNNLKADGYYIESYSAKEEDLDVGFDYQNALEQIFYIFNMKHPQDYKNRSLSVGDVVKINDRKFLCLPVGWKEINDEIEDAEWEELCTPDEIGGGK